MIDVDRNVDGEWHAAVPNSDSGGTSGTAATPDQAVAAALDRNHREYGSRLPKIDAEPGPEDVDR